MIEKERTPQPTFILASNSPRRRQLLGFGGWTFNVQAAEVDETPLPGELPHDYVGRLAEAKARAIAAQVDETHPDAVVIAADTTVVDGDEILGKPADPAEAAAMLLRLRGRAHQVHTGLVVLRAGNGHLISQVATTEVPMRAYTDAEIQAYIATGDPFDKAGGYAIQHPGFHPVAHLDGCYANVVGLPLCHLVRALAQIEIRPNADVPGTCQAELGYICPIFEQVLRGRP